jgi:antitoxin FitA
MAVLTVRNLPDEVHRALRLRAAQHGRSMEAEVRSILEDTVKPPARVKLGALLREMSHRAGLTNADVLAMETSIDTVRDRAAHEPMRFD